MKHGFQFSSSTLETLDKTTACMVFGTSGILGTVMVWNCDGMNCDWFWCGCKTLNKNFRQMFRTVRKFDRFSTQNFQQSIIHRNVGQIK